jgi:hypothetical protein
MQNLEVVDCVRYSWRRADVHRRLVLFTYNGGEFIAGEEVLDEHVLHDAVSYREERGIRLQLGR